VINIVYGLTSAKFDNPFRDIRNVDNIVAKRGALFMIDLKHALQDKGVQVVHIKTDSVKIPNATPEIIEFVTEFGAKYGYEFEHEETYDKFCLVNDAVYVAGIQTVPWEEGFPSTLDRSGCAVPASLRVQDPVLGRGSPSRTTARVARWSRARCTSTRRDPRSRTTRRCAMSARPGCLFR
jgi:hypothetical protein